MNKEEAIATCWRNRENYIEAQEEEARDQIYSNFYDLVHGLENGTISPDELEYHNMPDID